MTDTVGDASASRRVATFVSLLGLALIIYTPWQSAPFDILDFSELLPILRGSDSFVETFRDVAAYYRDHGRSNFITSAFIALNWEVFGEAPLGWRLFRTAIMGISLWLTIRFLARLGFSTPALASGAAVIVVALSAAGNWLRLTGEPLAYIWLVLSLEIGAGYRTCERWRRRLTGLACLVLAMLLTKETMLATIPAVVMVAAFADSRFEASRPARNARTVWLGAILLGVAVLCATSAWWVAVTTSPGAYVETYGRADVGVATLTAAVQRILFPMGDVGGTLVWWNVLFAGFVVVGCVIACLGPARGRARLLVAMGAYLILAGAAVYMPWGRFEYFYGLPFALGTVLLLTVATESLMRRAGTSRSLVFAGLVIALATPATLSQLFGARTYATRALNWDIAGELSRFTGVDSFVVAVEGLSAQPWQGRAATLRRVARLLGPSSGPPLPPAVDKQCEMAMELARGAPFRVAILSYQPGCGRLPDPERTWVRRFDYAKVGGFAAAHEEIRADLAVPAVDSLSPAGSR